MKIKGTDAIELQIKCNENINYVFERIKNLIKSNLDNGYLNTLEVKHYCNFCKNKVVQNTLIDFNNNVIYRTVDSTCNSGYGSVRKEKLKYNNKIDNKDEIKFSIDVNDFLSEKYLAINIGEFINICISESYPIEEYELYGKKIYSEVKDEDVLRIFITSTKKGVNIYFENLGEKKYKNILTKIKLR